MSIERRFIGTYETSQFAYSIFLRYEPPYTDEWEDEISGELKTEYYGSDCAVELVRHYVGQNPLECTPAWVQLDYSDNAFPHILDVEGVEWATLFDEAAREWTEFHETRADYAERAHLISGLFRAVGL